MNAEIKVIILSSNFLVYCQVACANKATCLSVACCMPTCLKRQCKTWAYIVHKYTWQVFIWANVAIALAELDKDQEVNREHWQDKNCINLLGESCYHSNHADLHLDDELMKP